MNYIFMFIYLLVLKGTLGLRQIKLLLPPVVEEGERTILRCLYDLEGDSLYAIKWYKGRELREFLRYTPQDSPPLKEFKIPVLFVDTNRSNSTQLVLDNVSRENSGQYTCEVTVEQSFQTIMMSAHLLVAQVPEEDPTIHDLKQSYYYGQPLRATCYSPPSYPAMNLTFLINGIPITEGRYLKRFKPVSYDNLEISKLTIQRTLQKHSFPNHRLKVRCSAFLYDLYERSVEKTVIITKMPPPPRPTPFSPVHRATALPAEQVPHTTIILSPGAEEQNGKSSAETITCSYYRFTLAYIILLTIKIINCINCSS